MKIEDQVCSLELAKRLKELGVKQNSYFKWTYWSAAPKDNPYAIPLVVRYDHELTQGERAEVCAAFTVAELGEMLPAFYMPVRDDEVHDGDAKWLCVEPEPFDRYYEHTEADARAKMLIYLIENKLIAL